MFTFRRPGSDILQPLLRTGSYITHTSVCKHISRQRQREIASFTQTSISIVKMYFCHHCNCIIVLFELLIKRYYSFFNCTTEALSCILTPNFVKTIVAMAQQMANQYLTHFTFPDIY